MRLERNTSLYPAYGYETKETEHFEIVDTDLGGGVAADISGFGGQNSSFTVFLSWEDIEQAITKFAEADEPRAIALQKARRLAEAVKDCLATDPPSRIQ
jgi:hypothetical protein